MLDLACDDIVMGSLHLFDASGLSCGLLATVSAEATLVLQPRFSARRALETIAAERVTVVEGTPAMYRLMFAAAARYPQDLSSLRLGVSIGPSMPVGMLRRFEDTLGCTMVQATDFAKSVEQKADVLRTAGQQLVSTRDTRRTGGR